MFEKISCGQNKIWGKKIWGSCPEGPRGFGPVHSTSNSEVVVAENVFHFRSEQV